MRKIYATLLLAVICCVCFAQQRVSGIVVEDPGNEPLIGVAVAIKGTNQGTVTDVDGKFSIEVPVNKILSFSYLGMVTQDIKIKNGMGPLTIKMKKDAMNLDEVVVVGYGTVKKVNLTGAVASVDSKVLEDRPLVNIGQGLQGVVPNLVVTPGNSRPGKGAEFNIRGTTSINGGSPLILVDGVQMDINLVNPEDVESVSVLKDAASSAIYGARAAYGVILVTTKSGKKNVAPRVSLKATVVFNQPTVQPEPMNSMEYVNFMNMVERNSGGGDVYSAEVIKRVEAYYNDPVNNLPVYYDPTGGNQRYQYVGNTNWVKETIRPFSVNQLYNVDINGGSEKSTYYASLGVMDQGGLMKLTDDVFRRYNANINVTTDITKWLQVSARTKYSHGDTEGPSGGKYYDYNTGVLGYDLNPLLPVRHPDGNYSGQGSITNGAALAAQGGRTNVLTNDLWFTGAVKLTPLEGLTVNADYTFNYYSRDYKRHDRSYKEYLAVPGVYVMFPHTNPNRVTQYNNADYYSAVNAYADYTRQFGKHNFKVMAGYNQETKKYSGYGVSRTNLINNELPFLGLATGTMNIYTTNVGSWNSNIPQDLPSDNELVKNANQEWAVQGYFFRLNYNFDDRYLLEVNGRYDGSSRFPSSGRWAFFPSFSAAWRLSKESFMEGTKSFLDDLKFRVSYGELGNQNIGNFDYMPSMPTNTNFQYIFGNTQPVAVTAPGLVNPKFTWETVRQVDVGFDFTVLQNRLKGTFDWYNRYTLNMLTSPAPLPNVLGAAQPRDNAADLKTYGWELSLNWNDRIESCDLYYNVGVVLSDNQTKITHFDVADPAIGANREGKMWGEIWGYTSDGFFQTDEEAAAANQSQLYGGKWYAGDVRYKDLNGDGKISNGKGTVADPGDMKIIGNTTPRYSFGITGGAQWKGIGLQLFFQGVAKRDVPPEGNFYGARREVAPFKSALDYWTPENLNARIARQSYNNGNRYTQTGTLQNAAYMRLKSLTLSYDLPKQWASVAKMQNVRVYFTGENMFTVTKLYRDYDPEQTDNIYAYPLARMYSLGLNITF